MHLIEIVIRLLFAIDMQSVRPSDGVKNLRSTSLSKVNVGKTTLLEGDVIRRSHSNDTEQDDENDQLELLDDAMIEDWRNDPDNPDRREIIRDYLSHLR